MGRSLSSRKSLHPATAQHCTATRKSAFVEVSQQPTGIGPFDTFIMKFVHSVLFSIAATGSNGLLPAAMAFVPAKSTSRSPSATSFHTASFGLKDTHRKPRVTSLKLAVDDEDDDDDSGEPLSKGIDSVSWLPSVLTSSSQVITSVKDGNEILPLFPLGGIVYTPNSQHVLNIFEPRYRQMYSDILMNGSKRFVVSMSHPTEQGRFAQTGVLFALEDLKEVSEQTGDAIKYICNHKVVGRVKLHRVINPEAWASRETYLKVEGTIFDDTQEPVQPASNDVYGAIASAAASKDEQALRSSFISLVTTQHELEEDIRFTKASSDRLAVKDGPGEDGLWQTIRLWQSYVDQRLVGRQNELQRDFQEKLQAFLRKEKGIKDEELPSMISFQDLSPQLQQEVKELQKRMAAELEPLVLESTLTMQKILEADSHSERCKLVKFFIDAERKRLSAKKSLQGMFNSAPTMTTENPGASSISEQGQLGDKVSSPNSIFIDEDDAFQ